MIITYRELQRISSKKLDELLEADKLVVVVNGIYRYEIRPYQGEV